jgi:hypothetical protein
MPGKGRSRVEFIKYSSCVWSMIDLVGKYLAGKNGNKLHGSLYHVQSGAMLYKFQNEPQRTE